MTEARDCQRQGCGNKTRNDTGLCYAHEGKTGEVDVRGAGAAFQPGATPPSTFQPDTPEAQVIAALRALPGDTEILDIMVERDDFGGQHEWMMSAITYRRNGATRTFLGGNGEGDDFYVDAPGPNNFGTDGSKGRASDQQGRAVIHGGELVDIPGAVSNELDDDAFDHDAGRFSQPHLQILSELAYALPEISDRSQLWRLSDQNYATVEEQQIPNSVRSTLEAGRLAVPGRATVDRDHGAV